MVEDLFSADLDLLIQCPNGRHAVGQVIIKFHTMLVECCHEVLIVRVLRCCSSAAVVLINNPHP